MAKSKVLIENDKTIVTEWSFDVGDSTGIHTHEYNYIVVPMLDGELKIIDKNNHETISNTAFSIELDKSFSASIANIFEIGLLFLFAEV